MRLRPLALFFATLLAWPMAASAAPVKVSTGDLGENVIDRGGLFTTFLPATKPSTMLPATIDVKEGLWNDPRVNVYVLFNGRPVGAFEAWKGYILPGPEHLSFDVTGLVLDGVNTITFDGHGKWGDYVIGQVDLNYDDSEHAPVPEPGTMALLGIGAALAAVRARRPSR